MKRILCVLLLLILPACGLADEYFIICQPDSYVNVRISPNKNAAVIGRYEMGQMVKTDGKKKNGFVHLTDLALENSDGWVSAGFITGELTIDTQTARIGRDRVACRRSIKGNRRKWLQKGDIVTVFAWSDDWAVTNQGFVMTEFLEVRQ